MLDNNDVLTITTRASASPGIELLRAKRGSENVTFKDVCDHLVDYLKRWPQDLLCIDRLGKFLAAVEDVNHQHKGGRDSKITILG